MSTEENTSKTVAPTEVHDTVAEVLQLDDLLEEFYTFMYEKAVLVGPTGTSPPKVKSPGKANSGSPTRGSFPTRETNRKQQIPGPPAASVPAAASGVSTPSTTLSREVMDALLPPKYVHECP
ncbi:unnamed protein product [Phytophthora fragariaefolia]|uniref:Unnamed protein product n=1 Tax=Phytophthora fragariaefolia TaxID=1490495 RepID=A0A9W7CPB7_9STRA|nr:unnamed protein product [Phytophthora fragariaefolia]